MRFLKIWFIPLLVSVGLFLILRPTFAQIVDGPQVSLSDYLKDNNVEVGSEAVEGFTQVYYIFDTQRKFITQGSVNSNIPVTDGEQIVYRKSLPGGDQIFVYNFLTEQTIQITSSGHNANPRIDGKNIVWEGLVDGNWQIFLFDGTVTTQLTSGDTSFNPEIEGDYVSYTRRDITSTYRAVVYSINRKQAKEITTGIKAKHPKVEKGRILLSDGKENFPLTVEDLFVLELAPLSASDSARMVTLQDISDELNATVSGIIESPVATESGSINI